jgi:DNA gyrase/topoisomerase IV subunit A
LILRGVVAEEEGKKGTQLVIAELPYQVNKAELIIKIADLVKDILLMVDYDLIMTHKMMKNVIMAIEKL